MQQHGKISQIMLSKRNKTDAQVNAMYDFIYVKFKNRENTVYDVRSQEAVGIVTKRIYEWAPGMMVMVSCFGLDSSYMNLFTL